MDEYQQLWDDWELLDQLDEELDNPTDGLEVIGRKRRRIIKGKMLWQIIYFFLLLLSLTLRRRYLIQKS